MYRYPSILASLRILIFRDRFKSYSIEFWAKRCRLVNWNSGPYFVSLSKSSELLLHEMHPSASVHTRC